MWLSLLNIALAVGGMSVAGYIIKSKSSQNMACPLHGDCHAVVNSSYARFLGIPIERMGVAYYMLVAASALTVVLFAPADAWIQPVLLPITTAAMLFSIYLTSVQLIALRQICTWCLISAVLSAGIWASSFAHGADTAIPFLLTMSEPLRAVQMFGLALGIGGITMSDLLFFRFIRNFRIESYEAKIITFANQFSWAALGITIIAQLGLVLPDLSGVWADPVSRLRLMVLAALAVLSVLLQILVIPSLMDMSFEQEIEHNPHRLFSTRHSAFALGAVTLVSWYTSLICLFIPNQPAFTLLLSFYLGALVLALFAAHIAERAFVLRAQREGR